MPDAASTGRVAYLVKGWPRLSEIFIASELARLEQLGLSLDLHVIKPADEDLRHAVVDRILAPVQYMPPTTSLSATTLPRWLLANLKPFLPAVAQVARRKPIGFARAIGAAVAQSIRARQGFRPRSVYAKEFLQAAVLSHRMLASGDVRHLHAHFAHGATTVAWLAHLMTGVPFSFTGHAKDIYSPRLNPAGLLRRKMRAARFVVTCTGANREHLQGVCPETQVRLVYHGMNDDFQRLLAEGARPVPEGKPRILGVGRLVAKKGFDTMVDALAILRERNIEFDAVIAGEHGDHEPLVRARILALGLDKHVTLVGPKTQAELAVEYRRATVFCLPCRVLSDGDRDGIPNVLVEAMATGVPVVTSPISGIPELVIHEDNGLFAQPDDPVAVADCLARVIRDPHLAAQLANRARATVSERFDGDRLAVQMAALFAGGQ